MESSGESQVRAMQLLTSALQLLDESDTPADVGAHVHTAIARLNEVLDQSRDSDQKVSQ